MASSSAVYQQDCERSSFLVGNQWPDAFFVFVNPFHARHVEENGPFESQVHTAESVSGRVLQLTGRQCRAGLQPCKTFGLEINHSLYLQRNPIKRPQESSDKYTPKVVRGAQKQQKVNPQNVIRFSFFLAEQRRRVCLLMSNVNMQGIMWNRKHQGLFKKKIAFSTYHMKRISRKIDHMPYMGRMF